MKKKDNNKPPGSKPQDKETADSINNGKKAIEVQKKTTATNPARQEKESKDDAEKWRNEG